MSSALSPSDVVMVGNRPYKRDALVTVKDIEALVERKRVELHVTPWSELKVKEEASMPADDGAVEREPQPRIEPKEAEAGATADKVALATEQVMRTPSATARIRANHDKEPRAPMGLEIWPTIAIVTHNNNNSNNNNNKANTSDTEYFCIPFHVLVSIYIYCVGGDRRSGQRNVRLCAVCVLFGRFLPVMSTSGGPPRLDASASAPRRSDTLASNVWEGTAPYRGGGSSSGVKQAKEAPYTVEPYNRRALPPVPPPLPPPPAAVASSLSRSTPTPQPGYPNKSSSPPGQRTATPSDANGGSSSTPRWKAAPLARRAAPAQGKNGSEPWQSKADRDEGRRRGEAAAEAAPTSPRLRYTMPPSQQQQQQHSSREPSLQVRVSPSSRTQQEEEEQSATSSVPPTSRSGSSSSSMSTRHHRAVRTPSPQSQWSNSPATVPSASASASASSLRVLRFTRRLPGNEWPQLLEYAHESVLHSSIEEDVLALLSYGNEEEEEAAAEVVLELQRPSREGEVAYQELAITDVHTSCSDPGVLAISFCVALRPATRGGGGPRTRRRVLTRMPDDEMELRVRLCQFPLLHHLCEAYGLRSPRPAEEGSRGNSGVRREAGWHSASTDSPSLSRTSSSASSSAVVHSPRLSSASPTAAKRTSSSSFFFFPATTVSSPPPHTAAPPEGGRETQSRASRGPGGSSPQRHRPPPAPPLSSPSSSSLVLPPAGGLTPILRSPNATNNNNKNRSLGRQQRRVVSFSPTIDICEYEVDPAASGRRRGVWKRRQQRLRRRRELEDEENGGEEVDSRGGGEVEGARVSPAPSSPTPPACSAAMLGVSGRPAPMGRPFGGGNSPRWQRAPEWEHHRRSPTATTTAPDTASGSHLCFPRSLPPPPRSNSNSNSPRGLSTPPPILRTSAESSARRPTAFTPPLSPSGRPATPFAEQPSSSTTSRDERHTYPVWGKARRPPEEEEEEEDGDDEEDDVAAPTTSPTTLAALPLTPPLRRGTAATDDSFAFLASAVSPHIQLQSPSASKTKTTATTAETVKAESPTPTEVKEMVKQAVPTPTPKAAPALAVAANEGEGGTPQSAYDNETTNTQRRSGAGPEAPVKDAFRPQRTTAPPGSAALESRTFRGGQGDHPPPHVLYTARQAPPSAPSSLNTSITLTAPPKPASDPVREPKTMETKVAQKKQQEQQQQQHIVPPLSGPPVDDGDGVAYPSVAPTPARGLSPISATATATAPASLLPLHRGAATETASPRPSVSFAPPHPAATPTRRRGEQRMDPNAPPHPLTRLGPTPQRTTLAPTTPTRTAPFVRGAFGNWTTAAAPLRGAAVLRSSLTHFEAASRPRAAPSAKTTPPPPPASTAAGRSSAMATAAVRRSGSASASISIRRSGAAPTGGTTPRRTCGRLPVGPRPSLAPKPQQPVVQRHRTPPPMEGQRSNSQRAGGDRRASSSSSAAPPPPLLSPRSISAATTAVPVLDTSQQMESLVRLMAAAPPPPLPSTAAGRPETAMDRGAAAPGAMHPAGTDPTLHQSAPPLPVEEPNTAAVRPPQAWDLYTRLYHFKAQRTTAGDGDAGRGGPANEAESWIVAEQEDEEVPQTPTHATTALEVYKAAYATHMAASTNELLCAAADDVAMPEDKSYREDSSSQWLSGGAADGGASGATRGGEEAGETNEKREMPQQTPGPATREKKEATSPTAPPLDMPRARGRSPSPQPPPAAAAAQAPHPEKPLPRRAAPEDSDAAPADALEWVLEPPALPEEARSPARRTGSAPLLSSKLITIRPPPASGIQGSGGAGARRSRSAGIGIGDQLPAAATTPRRSVSSRSGVAGVAQRQRSASAGPSIRRPLAVEGTAAGATPRRRSGSHGGGTGRRSRSAVSGSGPSQSSRQTMRSSSPQQQQRSASPSFSRRALTAAAGLYQELPDDLQWGPLKQEIARLVLAQAKEAMHMHMHMRCGGGGSSSLQPSGPAEAPFHSPSSSPPQPAKQAPVHLRDHEAAEAAPIPEPPPPPAVLKQRQPKAKSPEAQAQAVHRRAGSSASSTSSSVPRPASSVPTPFAAPQQAGIAVRRDGTPVQSRNHQNSNTARTSKAAAPAIRSKGKGKVKGGRAAAAQKPLGIISIPPLHKNNRRCSCSGASSAFVVVVVVVGWEKILFALLRCLEAKDIVVSEEDRFPFLRLSLFDEALWFGFYFIIIRKKKAVQTLSWLDLTRESGLIFVFHLLHLFIIIYQSILLSLCNLPSSLFVIELFRIIEKAR
eukprot:gene12585-8624_t